MAKIELSQMSKAELFLEGFSNKKTSVIFSFSIFLSFL